MYNAVSIYDNIRCGPGEPLLLIAGPCVLESIDVADQIIDKCVEVCNKYNIDYVFKASFDKANRTSIYSERGPGFENGIKMLNDIRNRYNISVITDFHEPSQARELALNGVDIIQIPAMLSRQTDMLKAAAYCKLPVLIKKSQSASPQSMRYILEKLEFYGCYEVILCERGTFFGYGRLVNDMTGLVEMREFGVPICFDATHSVQTSSGDTSGGRQEMIVPLAKAAAAVGIDALFLEVHPEPWKAWSDGGCMLQLEELEPLLESVQKIRGVCG